jgi:tetratricopeptide (TPR) repeat protein
MMRRLTSNTPDTGLGGSLYALAINLQHQGRLPEAEAVARESLSVMSEATGSDSSWTVSPFFRLMVILSMQGKTEELEKLFLEQPIPSSGRPGYRGDLLASRAKLLSDKGAFAEAEDSYREALAVRKQTFGNENASTIETLHLLIEVLERGGKEAEAEILRRESGATTRARQSTETP